MTQAELSRRSGIHRPNICRIEAGTHDLRVTTLRRIADALGVELAELVS